MPIIPKFRTFVNELGVSPNISLISSKYLRSSVIVDAQTYMQLYWRFYKLTIDYKYTVNNQPISRLLVVTDDEPNYKSRIDATWEVFKELSLKEGAGISSMVAFSLSCPTSPFSDNPLDEDCREKRSKMAITASRHAQRVDPNTKIHLSFLFEELASNADFHFDNNSPALLEDYQMYKTLHTLTTDFLGSPQTFYLYTSSSKIKQGYINYVKITYELYDLPNENS